MKKDEAFEPSIKSTTLPEGIIFRLATRADLNAISNLMAERNPFQSFAEIEASTNREIDRVESGVAYKLFVAELRGSVLGFCRFYHSDGLPPNKKINPSPEGWYGMGILVSSKSRRQNIARFLSTERIKVLKSLGAIDFYSVVDANNLTSMKMHQEFGFVEIKRAPGFLHISFNDSIGCLYKLSI